MIAHRLVRAVTALALALGVLAVAAPTASASHESPYHRSTTVTTCLDGPNHFGQMYEVDCSVPAQAESDDLCESGPYGNQTCDGPTGVDSNTTCLYQFDHTENSSEVVDGYEIGPCPVRGDQADPSDGCVNHVAYPDGTHLWAWYGCPADLYGNPVVPVTLTLTGQPTATVPGKPFTLTFSVRDDHDQPVVGMPLSLHTRDGDGFGEDTEVVSNGDQTQVTLTGLDRATTLTAYTTADDRYALDRLETTLDVQPTVTLKATRKTTAPTRYTLTGQVAVAETTTRVPVRLQRYSHGAWSTVATITAWAGKASFARRSPGTYRLFAPAVRGRLAATSAPVHARRQPASSTG